MKRRIVCFHLLNDFSGSPKVLHDVLEGLLEDGHEVDLVTSRGGVLDTLKNGRLRRRSHSYAFSSNPLVTIYGCPISYFLYGIPLLFQA